MTAACPTTLAGRPSIPPAIVRTTAVSRKGKQRPRPGPMAVSESEAKLPVLPSNTCNMKRSASSEVVRRAPPKTKPRPVSALPRRKKRDAPPALPGESPGAFADGEWENELARRILVLYGSAVKGRGADIAIDEDDAAPRTSKRSKVHPIWFMGSGSLSADWSALGEPESFGRQLGALEEAGHYLAYVDAVAQSLNTYARQHASPGDLFSRLWRQLSVTSVVFGVKCVDRRRHADALELLKRAHLLAASPAYLAPRDTAELEAFCDDAHAYYYSRRAKLHAALAFATRAMRTHLKLAQFAHVAKCHIHVAVVLSRMRRHPEAVRCLGQVLHLVDTGRLDLTANQATPHKLCMIAVCYHNIAVEQIHLHHAAEAAVSAQNARRLARLCLSYSNRWLHNFEATHKCAADLLALQGSGLPDTTLGDLEESRRRCRP